MNKNILTELLHQADRKTVQEAVAHLQDKFAFRNAEFLKLKSEKEKTEQQYQNLVRTHQELLREYEHLHISVDKSNKELSELKIEIRKKDELLEEKQRQFEQTQKEIYETKRLLQESQKKQEYLLTEINSFKEKQERERERFGREIGHDGRFIAYDNGIVVDVETKLMWAGKDNCEDIGWYHAREFCNNCTLGDYNDWRMPNIGISKKIIYPNLIDLLKS